MKYFNSAYLKLKEQELYEIFFKNDKSQLIIRGDILPQPREIFVGLIKDSVKDVLLTGNESIVDTLSNFMTKQYGIKLPLGSKI